MKLDAIGTVRRGDGESWQTARVMVDDDDRAAVWSGRGHENILVWSGQATSATADRLVTADGQTFDVQRRGCGCGSQLRNLGTADLARAVAA